VRAALDKLREGRPERFEEGTKERGMRFHFGMPLRGLASELGVTRSELKDALQEVGKKASDRFEQDQKELAEFLADRFNLDVDKVRDALPPLGPPLKSAHRPGVPDHLPAP
jgi:hypothetical protein